MASIDLPCGSDAISAFASVVTGSKSLLGPSTSHGIAPSHKRGRGSPLLAGFAGGITPSRGKLNLPDKEFRWFCYQSPEGDRAGHFCRPPYVAAGSGPSLHLRRTGGGWRMVSEDSGPRLFCASQPFLLIFRRGPCQPHTSRIVTSVHGSTLDKG